MAQGIAPNRRRQVPAEDTPAFGAIAERFRRAGDLERAVALCQEGLAKFPDHLSARVTLGWCLLDLGRYEEAREALEGALKRAPDNLAAIRGLAELHDRAEHTMLVPMDGPGQWPPDPSALDNLHVDPSADMAPASAPADLPLRGEALSLDSLLSRAAQKGKARGKGKKGTDGAEAPQAFEPLDVLINPTPAESGPVPDLIQSRSHREPKTSDSPDLNALIDEIDQIGPAVPAGPATDDAGVDLGLSADDGDIEKALQQAQAAAEQAAADAVATRRAAEQQAATDSKARKAAEENAAAEAAARKAAEDRAASETAARKAAEEKAAAETKARKAAEEKAAAEKAAAEAAAKKAAEKAAQEAAARKAAEEKAAAEAAAKKKAEEKAAAEAAAKKKAADEKAAAEAASKKAADEQAAAEEAAKAAAEKAATEAKARKAAEQKAAAEAAARRAAEEKAAAETAARQAAEAAATRAAEERAAAAEAAARKAAEEMAEAGAAAKQAAKAAAADADARVAAAEQRADLEVAARVAAEQAVLDARPALSLKNPTVRDFPDPALEIRVEGTATFEASPSPGSWEIPLLDSAADLTAEDSADIELEQLAAELSALDTGSSHPALPALESLLRRVETRRSQLMTESVA